MPLDTGRDLFHFAEEGAVAYLAQLRAAHAATLLLHSDQPVTCIGREVGWADQNYFARRFKAHYGLSATTYRAVRS
ncbi:MAG: helix-turn-helix domain-containing protein [Streptosporangiaceae bacterium]|jgi:AraC family L-rhamnose operon transcriptional activator RhaR